MRDSYKRWYIRYERILPDNSQYKKVYGVFYLKVKNQSKCARKPPVSYLFMTLTTKPNLIRFVKET